MGFYCHLHVCFPCDENSGVSKVASKCLEDLNSKGEEVCIHSKMFLEELASRVGANPGSKGGLSLWGIVGNYVNVRKFTNDLIPFWERLLSGEIPGGPCKEERVIIFYEKEQSEKANAIEIYLDWRNNYALTVKEHECPFSWMLM